MSDQHVSPHGGLTRSFFRDELELSKVDSMTCVDEGRERRLVSRSTEDSGRIRVRQHTFGRCLVICGLASLCVLALGSDLSAQHSPPWNSGTRLPVATPARFETRAPRGVIQQTEFEIDQLLDEPLADVVVEGNTTILPNSILQQIETRSGRVPSSRQIQQDVTQLLNTRWFLNVRPFYRQTRQGPVLVFEVVERPILKSVQFLGNKKIKTSELQAHTGLITGHGYDVAANRESVERIKTLYRERGYRFAEVTLEQGNTPDERDVVFRINEGPKVKIWGIDFVGNKFVSGAVLKTKLSSKTVILWVIRGDYDPEVVRTDAQAIKQYYMQLGFFDVDVDYAERFSEDKGKVYVTYKITEGPRYKIGSIELVGNQTLPRQKLLSKLELPAGEFFNSRLLREDVAAMQDQYDDIGRMFAKIEPVPQFRENESGVVDLVYQIDEDIPRKWGQVNIHIRGEHTHTKPEVLRQQIHRYLQPGQLARGRDWRMAQARVQGSNIWERSDPPTFNITPVDGIDYLPAMQSRGQDAERDNLTETSAVWSPQSPDRVFGHTLRPLNAFPRNERPAGAVSLPSPRAGPRPRPSQPSPSKTPVWAKPGSAIIPPDVIFRGQSPGVYRGQSLNQYGNPVPQDYLQGVSPQGDPFGDALSRPPMPGFVDVNIDVTEGRTGRLMFGVGVNSDAGVVGSLVLQEDSFDIMRPPTSWSDIVNGRAWRGGGQSFRMEAVPGSQVSRYLISWQDPFFLRSDFSLGVSGFYYNRFFNEWDEDRLGGPRECRLRAGPVLVRHRSLKARRRRYQK